MCRWLMAMLMKNQQRGFFLCILQFIICFNWYRNFCPVPGGTQGQDQSPLVYAMGAWPSHPEAFFWIYREAVAHFGVRLPLSMGGHLPNYLNQTPHLGGTHQLHSSHGSDISKWAACPKAGVAAEMNKSDFWSEWNQTHDNHQIIPQITLLNQTISSCLCSLGVLNSY